MAGKRRTTKELIEQTVTISVQAMQAEFETSRRHNEDVGRERDGKVEVLSVAVDRLTIAVMGDGKAARGIQGDVQDMRKALFGNGAEPDNPGLCERVRILGTWKDAWDRLKWLVVGGAVTIGLGLIIDIVIHVMRAGAVP
jgi:hypothetical protein